MSSKVLYTFGGSVWAAAAELAAAELGYTDSTLTFKTINLIEGENFTAEFLQKNPNATLPTLEADGKFYTSTAAVISHLAANAPNKVKAGTSIVETIHDDKYDPNFALLLARSDEELSAKAKGVPGLFVSKRQAAIDKYLQDATGSHKEFLEGKKATNGGLLAIVTGAAPAEHTAGFYAKSQAHFASIKTALFEVVPGFLPESGFIAGEVPGEDDFHVGAWLTRIAATTGATSAADGLDKLAAAYGSPLPSKITAYWAAWTARDSWKKVYATALH
uniref:GST N-terminal domain-containing protein n=1 Tax=Mycena chlorophos TaxID=658473 RepID=A0ABQ0LF70_MYCCL|nr:predicted protein [Mycena chlorophos]